MLRYWGWSTCLRSVSASRRGRWLGEGLQSPSINTGRSSTVRISHWFDQTVETANWTNWKIHEDHHEEWLIYHHLTSPHITFIHFLANFPHFPAFLAIICYPILSNSNCRCPKIYLWELLKEELILLLFHGAGCALKQRVIQWSRQKKMASRSWNFL